MTDDHADPRTFYDDYGTDEWDRLATGIDGRLEFEFTARGLADRLPESGHVLDAGGGSGRYAVWLANRGYDVTLADLSAEQLAVADRKTVERGVGDRVDLSQGTVADLPFEDDAFDATLCLGGPVSHLLDEAERERAIAELRRVSRPDAPVFVSVMGLLGAVQLYALTGHNVRALPDLVEDGDYDEDLLAPYGYENEFAPTHFFRRDELVELLEGNGVEVDVVTGLEGLGSPFHDEGIREGVDSLPADDREAIVDAFERLREDPAVADLSVHVLAVGRAPSE